MVNNYYDGRIPVELTDLFNAREQALLAEALMIEQNIPCKRQFTHDELEPYVLKIRQAAQDIADIPTYWSEKAKDRREEFKEEDAINRERAYPERQP